jgi:hypothetical protein
VDEYCGNNVIGQIFLRISSYYFWRFPLKFLVSSMNSLVVENSIMVVGSFI